MPEEQLSVIELEGSLADVEKPKDLRPGTYTAEVQNVSELVSQKGNTYYAIEFVIPSDELPADMQDENPDGVRLYWNRVLKPIDGRSRYNLKVFMEALGMDTNVSSVDPNDFMGCRARLRVRNETYQGNTRPGIQSVEAAEKQAGNRRPKVAPVEVEDEDEQEPTPRRGRPAAKTASRPRR